uniref:MurR/RpiR family transcriptional regulator n=1 Tax=Burkholderia sp. Ac-20379 TaxID=2703900 RepID=UPI00197EC519
FEHHHALLRQTAFDAPAEALARARMVYVYGQGGGSTALADELRFRLVRFGRPVASYQDALLQRMVASTVDAQCVVVALSVTGRVPELLESCALAKRYGARIVALTAPASPLAQLADDLIPVVAFETDFIFKPSTSRYAMMMALDVLVTEVALRLGDGCRETLRRMKHALDVHRGGGDRQPLGD